MLTQLLCSVLLGLLIGIERELKQKPAGMRTCAFVCLGSCLFALLGTLYDGPHSDPSRLAASAIQGIGFLGAGTILVHKEKIIGLTTSAIVWAVCAVGIACGMDHLLLAFEVTFLVLGITLFVTPAERKFLKHRQNEER